MTTATCFIRQEAPECCTASSEMEALKPAQLNWLCWQCLWSHLQAGGWDFSFLRLNIQLANGAACLSFCRQRLLQERQRVCIAHCPWQQNKTDCHPRFFSSRSCLDCFTSCLHFPFLFLKIENKFLGKGGAEHWSWIGTFLKVLKLHPFLRVFFRAQAMREKC